MAKGRDCEGERRRSLAEAGSQLDRLKRESAHAETARVESILVESYPTPLSTTVDGDEIHFQLRAGRLVFIPLEPLLAKFKEDAQQRARELLDLPEVAGTVGPMGGFRLRYTLERRQVSMETQVSSGQGGAFARLKRWTLIPVSGQLGELVDEALAEGSRFRSVLAGYRPADTAVTIWTYPDSFAEFRRLKKALFSVGFLTSARPLPRDVPIGGSPEGTRSAAQ